MGMLIGIIRALETLWRWELSNHRADSLQIKFIGTALPFRCAMAWSFAYGHSKGSWNLADAGTQQSLGWFTPNQVHWNRLGLYVCNIVVIFPWRHNGHAHGHDKGPWNLADAGTQHPLGRFTPNQVTCNRLGLWVCSSMVICLRGRNGHGHSSWNLEDAETQQPLRCK